MTETEFMKRTDKQALYQRLRMLGFDHSASKCITNGHDAKGLPEGEFIQVAHAWKSDSVEPLAPLVEKYGWEELVERFVNSTEKINHD